jgi:hypothetical protein
VRCIRADFSSALCRYPCAAIEMAMVRTIRTATASFGFDTVRGMNTVAIAHRRSQIKATTKAAACGSSDAGMPAAIRR